eukprot:jgi/Tetstr1/440674/TSEL_028983.t1
MHATARVFQHPLLTKAKAGFDTLADGKRILAEQAARDAKKVALAAKKKQEEAHLEKRNEWLRQLVMPDGRANLTKFHQYSPSKAPMFNGLHQAAGVKNAMEMRLKYNASTKVEYVQKAYKIPGEGYSYIGRMYPSNKRFVCFQNMLGSLRRIPIDNRYVEVDMQNARFQLLAGKYHNAIAIQSYISNREKHLLVVQEAAGVKRWVAKQLFIMLIFGGSVDSWKAENNIPETLQLPDICR